MKRTLTPTRIEWARVLGFRGYFVSSDGMVMSVLSGRPVILKQITKRTGYRYLFLYRNGAKHKKYVHTLVLTTFVGNPQEGQEARHLDGNPANNGLSNLRWGTREENQDDKVRHGRIRTGEDSPSHKLSAADVRRIRRLHGRYSLRELGRMFGVSHTAIRRAALGMNWNTVRAGIPDGTN